MDVQEFVRSFDSFEVSAVTVLSKIVPLLVPVIPAYVGYLHVVDQSSGLGFDPWAGWVYAIVVEGLGYSAVYKAVQFWEHNKRYQAEKNQAPLNIAIAIYVVYLVVTLLVNVVLEYKAGVQVYKVFALGFISILSLPAGLLTSISAIHAERMIERMNANVRRKNERPNTLPNVRRTSNERRTPSPFPVPSNEHKSDFGFRTNDEKQARLLQYVEALQSAGQQVPGPSDLGRQLGMSKGYVSDLLKEWRK